MNFRSIAVECFGPVRRISHNRPDFRNAESRELLDELDQSISRAVEDDTVRVIILAGKGDHFSAGHDLKEAQRERSGFSVEQRWMYEEKHYFEYCRRILNAPKPVIAQVQGACIAGGFMVANMCDIIIASEDAFFADPVVHTLGAAAVEVLVHPWVLGQRKARELLYTGGRLSSADAERLGMVNRVVPREELEATTLAMAEKIAEAPPFALRVLKRSLNRTLDAQGFGVALAAHFDTHQLSHLSEAFQSARSAGLAEAIKKS
ncbi:enoyl-CoA hydratase [Microvirga makkahensis]|uniref:Enoyl-CoA hydratase n=1 Tax=Microvirga makkahensis TaxID=1128670 RepID=A0A7X3MWY3_9HYPH|nr:enoyl-CoA hydratase [Microvirga makkahensis]MXQ14709.1 enoyl-CoA hydratase [Microvirga makkahensis]